MVGVSRRLGEAADADLLGTEIQTVSAMQGHYFKRSLSSTCTQQRSEKLFSNNWAFLFLQNLLYS
jgi:hypothetical protein